MKRPFHAIKAFSLLIAALILLSALTSCDIKDLFMEFTKDQPKNSYDMISDYPGCYGFASLKGEKDEKILKYVYEKIYLSAEAHTAAVDLSDYAEIYKDQVIRAMDLYSYDHPEHYFVDPTYYTMSIDSDDHVNYLELSFTCTKIQRAETDKQLEEILQKIFDGAKGIDDPFELELYLHDWVANNTAYKDGLNAHNALGVFLDHAAVCEGYAKAFGMLLKKAGFESFLVIGSGRGLSHMWNVVKLGDGYYHVDVTWDDPDGADHVSRAYFNLTTSEIATDHKIGEQPAPLPECTDGSMWYFAKKGLVLSKPFTTEFFEKAREDHTLIFALENEEDFDDFQNFLQDHLYDVSGFTKTPGMRIECALSSIGREIEIGFSLVSNES